MLNLFLAATTLIVAAIGLIMPGPTTACAGPVSTNDSMEPANRSTSGTTVVNSVDGV